MSKAFTKENDEAPDSSDDGRDEAESEALKVPAGAKNYMTPPGAERLKVELHKLLHEERPALVQTVSWAASNGDRSENGDYLYGKKRLREIDRRIRFLTKRLEISEVVDPATQSGDQVLFGARVTVRPVDSDDEDEVEGVRSQRSYRIVGIDESDAGQGEISWISPMARALLNHRVGDVVTLKRPRGDEELEIIRVEWT